jgi:D-alanyl-D-alanine carboxypeptidase (penicillin-binding protein 5/6)
MKLKGFLSILLIVCLFCVTGEALAARAKKARPAKKAAPSKAVTPKEDPYKAFVVVEASTGMVVDGENAGEKRSPASITKLMVAAVVLERIAKGQVKLTDSVTASRAASKIGGSQVYLKEGETFTLEELMKAMLVASGNDAAYAIAEFIAGSKEEFIKLMNEKAKELNMTNTEFQSVHGLPPGKDEKEDLTTCNDLVLLARDLLRYPKLIEWTSIKSEGFRDGTFTLQNHNKLLTKMPGVDGMKTGYYRSTGFNVVVTAKKGDLRFISVVMGSPTAKIRDTAAMEKLKKAFSQYKILNIVKRGEVVDKEVILEDGKYRKLKGTAKTDFLYPIASGRKGTVKKEPVFPEAVKGEVKEGQKLGELMIKLDNDVIGKVDIVSPVFVPKANVFTRIMRKLGLNL